MRNRRRSVAWLGIVLVMMMLASLVVPAGVPAVTGVVVGIGPDPLTDNYTANMAPGSTTTLKMYALGAVNMATYDMSLSISDANIVDITAAAGGTTSGFTSITASDTNDPLGAGTATMVHFTTSGQTGNVHFANITVQATGSAGESATINITINNLTDANGVELEPRTTQSATINIIGASFTSGPNKGAAPLTVQFTDTSTGAIGTWSWTFGDGGTSTAQNPSHTYSAGGTYTVSLAGAWTTPEGFENTVTATDLIKVIQAGFSAGPVVGTAPLTVQFTDTTTGPSPDTWLWDFGDGEASTEQNPSHAYAAGGTYTVSLTATNSTEGISDTDTQTALVNVVVADFSGTPLLDDAPMTVTFTNLSTGSPDTYLWTFGDGSTSTEESPSHTYTTGGDFDVTLVATNSATGGTDTETKAAYVKVVKADFSADVTTGMIPLTVNFTDGSTLPACCTITSWSWDFGDGSTSTAQNPSHTYTDAGEYTVALTITTDTGVTATETKTTYINAMSIVAQTSLAQELLVKTDVVRILVKIDDIVNPSTGLSEDAPGGIGAYEATASYGAGKVSMKTVAGVTPFSAVTANYSMDASGSFLFNSFQTGSTPQAPLTIAKLVPVLNSLATETVTLTVDFSVLSDGNGANIPEDPDLPLATMSFKRGDTNGDNAITIVDALFIAQYLAGLRTADTIKALNAASVNHDGTAGDKITIVDALYIAQYKALLRNNDYTPKF